MNSGELPLNTRRKVSLAPDEAGTENAAEASIEATAISRENRSREVFMFLSDRQAVKVMCDRKAVNASIRCAATRRALCYQVLFRLAIEWNLLQPEACAVS